MDSSSGATTAAFPVLHQTISGAVKLWAKARSLDLETLEKMPVGSGTAQFRSGRHEAIIFRYGRGWKARSIDDKEWTQKQGTKAAFWNLDAVLKGPLDKVYIVEGELDALAAVEVGIEPDQILALPSGTVGKLEYIDDALKRGLNKTKQYIWCGDNDEVGLEVRAAVVNALGTAKMRFMEWPDGCKDANQFLMTDGSRALLDKLINAPIDWPVKGLYRLSEIPDAAPLTVWDPGFDAWNNKLRLAAGTLSVATGHPGMGKTALWTQIWFKVAQQYGLTIAIASFETRAKPHICRMLRQHYIRKPEIAISDSERAQADAWIDQHYLFLIHPERRPDLTWTLDMASTAVKRHGARVLVVDPWNRLEAAREKGETETDYIGSCLRSIYNFAQDFNCHVQIIAHPSKMENVRRGHIPDLEDIAGSKHWDNMVDQGFVVHRPQMFDEKGDRVTYAELHYKKTRFDELGYPTKFGLDYDPIMCRFGSVMLQQKKSKPKTALDDQD